MELFISGVKFVRDISQGIIVQTMTAVDNQFKTKNNRDLITSDKFNFKVRD